MCRDMGCALTMPLFVSVFLLSVNVIHIFQLPIIVYVLHLSSKSGSFVGLTTLFLIKFMNNDAHKCSLNLAQKTKSTPYEIHSTVKV